MTPSFINYEKPLLTVMLKQIQNPENIIAEIKRALGCGAEAFGLQAESLPRKYHTAENFKKIFGEMQGKPLYITNYHHTHNAELGYDELADELLMFAELGATLCDIEGDMYAQHPEQITEDKDAIEKQMKLVEKLHEKGAEVLISSHVNKFTPAERVLEIALEHKRRGADISKIVTHANNMEEQIENLKITNLLKEKLGIPFLYLSGGECHIHRKLGIMLGCCMSLCICERPENSTNPQPLINQQKLLRDEIEFIKNT